MSIENDKYYIDRSVTGLTEKYLIACSKTGDKVVIKVNESIH